MTKYYIPDILPENSLIDDDGSIIIGDGVLINEEDDIEVKSGNQLRILPGIKLNINKIKNYGYIENGADVCVNIFENFGKLNNVDLFIVKDKFINNGKVENYYYLYLLKAKQITNNKKIKNYMYVGGIVFANYEVFTGNKIKNYT